MTIRNHGILFVDDEATIREVACCILGEFYRVYPAADAEAALAVLASECVDLLITDLHMPGMNGIELIDRARQLHPDLVCLALSGSVAQFQADLSARNLLALHKPYDMDELLAAVRRQLTSLSAPR